MLDWLIIGGGIHGTYLSNVLLYQNPLRGKNRLKVHVLDPHNEPMFCWNKATSSCGMNFLRSPRVHHIDINSNSLHQFAYNGDHHLKKFYTDPYCRPSLELFRNHSRNVLHRNNLDKIRILGSAVGIKEIRNGLLVQTTRGDLKTRRIFLCIGQNHPLWPPWARRLKSLGAEISHVFDENERLKAEDPKSDTLIVGNGLSAVQLALSQGMRTYRNLAILMKRKIAVHQFDSDPGWIGPKYLNDFHKIMDYGKRRKIINAARNRGSVMEDLARNLDLLNKKDQIEIIYGEVNSAVFLDSSRMVEIRIDQEEGKNIIAKRIILATGFEYRRPGGIFIDGLIENFGLPYADCNYPIVDEAVRWHPRIHVSGALAELEIGPVARNIAGARLVGKRIKSIL